MVYDLFVVRKKVPLWVILYFGSGKPNDVHVMVTDELRKAGFDEK